VKILFLSTENPFPVDHGHHIRTYHVLRGLAKKHRIFFVGFTRDDSGLEYQRQLRDLCEFVKIIKIRDRGFGNVISIIKNIFSSLPFVVQKYDQPVARMVIRKILADEKIDLVHLDMLPLAIYRNEFGSLPCVLVNHNVESLRLARWARIEKNVALKCFLMYQQRKLKRFEKAACPRFDRCIVVSDADRAILSKLCGAGNFVVIPNGVDIDYFNCNGAAAPAGQHLVWTGSMKSPYNRDAVVFFLREIWPTIQRDIPEATVTFVGASPISEFAGKSSSVTFTGYVDDVRPHVAGATVFIAPMRAGSGTKIKVLNAMAQAKPVITTTVGAEGIDVREGEELLIANEAEEFAKKTIHLLRNSCVAQKIGLCARRLIEKKYDWKIIELQIERLYQNITDP
jgi:glycosyltransferase involved in cell wall biosynthesis